jgi:hypothetical protein
MSSVAVTQPCVFPYIGYYQLVASPDAFVFYDDVTFMKGSWVNRNRFLLRSCEHLFTIPIRGASSQVPINQTYIDYDHDSRWQNKLLRTIELAYKGSRYFDSFFPVVEAIISTRYTYISDVAIASVMEILNFAEVDYGMVTTSSALTLMRSGRIERLVDICKSFNAGTYINSSGGRKLYRATDFAGYGIDLKFLEPLLVSYPQVRRSKSEQTFMPSLSVIDILMNCSAGTFREMLAGYRLSD